MTRIINSYFFTLLLIVISSAIYAQTGKVQGKVVDKATNETIIGASIQIEGTTLGGVTDLEGHYSISNVPVGKYNISISFVSYTKQQIQNVLVEEGKTQTVNAVLTEESQELNSIEIVATLNKQSTTELISLQQKSAVLSDGISGDAIKKSPDKNTGEVLRRVSGASIQDNKFVVIRGLSDRYNTALINGMPLPTTEPDRKAFSFDIFPAAMLDNMIIYKTASPDLPGDFAGGVIQINTRDIPEESYLSFSIGTGYNTQSTFQNFYTYSGGKKDWIGIDDGTRALPSAVSASEEFKTLLSSSDTKYESSSLFSNDWAIIPGLSSPVSQNYQLSFGSHSKVLKNDLGITGTVMYTNARKLVEINRGDFNTDTSRIYAYTDKQYKQNITSGAMLNFAYKIGENNKISFKNMLSINGEDMVVMREGFDNENQRFVKATSMQFTSNKLISSQLTGDHFISKGNIKIKWGGEYATIYRDVPDYRRMYYTENLGDSVFYAYVPVGAPSPNYAGKYYAALNEKLYAANGDITIPFTIKKAKQAIKIGASEQIKYRSFDARVFGYVISNSSQFDWNLLTYGQDSIFDPSHISPNGFQMKESTNPSDSYDANSHLFSSYVMFDNKIFDRLRIVWGLRYEKFNQQLSSVTYGGDTIQIDTTYIDILPSANLTFAINEKSNLRFSVSRTVARPEFRELAPFSFYDFNTSSSVYGNDTLVRTNITNFDVRYEIYPGFNQLFSITGFYKDFQNPIEQIVDASSGAGSRIFTYQNVTQAHNYGIELEYRVKLGYIDSLLHWKQWDNLTWFTNFSYIYSKVDLSHVASSIGEREARALQGQSPYIVNTGMQYAEQDLGLNISLLFNRIGRRIAQVGSNGYLDIYEAPRSLVDLQISKRIFKNGEIKFNASDILNQHITFYQDQNSSGKYEKGIDTEITDMKLGSTYSLSFSYKF